LGWEILPHSPNSPDLSPVSFSSSPTWKTQSAEVRTSIRIFETSTEIKKSLPVEWKVVLKKSIFLCSPMTDDHKFFWKYPLIVTKYFCEVLRKNIIPNQRYSKKVRELMDHPSYLKIRNMHFKHDLTTKIT
jgi:hypothetical protein